MIEYLTTTGLSHRLEELIKDSKKEIILVSPYVQLNKRIRELLVERKKAGVVIKIVCRVQDLREDLAEVASQIFDRPSLHAKCYLNNNAALVGSLNLYAFSQVNNDEMGFYIENEGYGKEAYEKIKDEANRLCASEPILISRPAEAPNLVEGRPYTAAQLDVLFDFEYAGPAGIRRTADPLQLVLSGHPQHNPEIDGIVYYHGQETGGRPQRLIFGNRALYDAYRNPQVIIYLFRQRIYAGTYSVCREPSLDEGGRWIFPLKRRG